MCTSTRTSWITAQTGKRISRPFGRISIGQLQTICSGALHLYAYSILTCCCDNVASSTKMLNKNAELRRSDGSTRGNLQVDARVCRNHLDRTPLLLQLGQWTAPDKTRWSD